MEKLFKAFGTFGSLSLLVCLIPQIYKLYKTKHAGELSLWWLILTIVGLSFLTMYGFYFKLWEVSIPIILQLLGFFTILGMKIYYDRINPEYEEEANV